MIAVDTNLLVRHLTQDDPVQSLIAEELLKNPGGVFVSTSVLLELEWVLRSAFHLPLNTVKACLLGVCGMSNIRVENAAQAKRAVDDFLAGVDFADALHAASNQADEGLYTFDKKFAKKAVLLGRNVHLAKVGGAVQSR